MTKSYTEIRAWYYGLKRYEQAYYKNLICQTLQVGHGTMHSWLYNPTVTVPVQSQRVINSITGQQVFDLPPID